MKEYNTSEMSEHLKRTDDVMKLQACIGFGFLVGAIGTGAGIIATKTTMPFVGFPLFFLTVGALSLLIGVYSLYQYIKITR